MEQSAGFGGDYYTYKRVDEMSLEELQYYLYDPNTPSETKAQISMYIMVHSALGATQTATTNIAKATVQGLNWIKSLFSSSKPAQEATSVILNLGAGTRPMAGAINIDTKAAKGIDLIADANKLPQSDASVDAIFAINPHGFYPLRGDAARVLKSGGLLTMTGNFSNKYFKDAYMASAEKLKKYGFELVSKGELGSSGNNGFHTTGEAIEGVVYEIILRRI